LSWIPLPFTSSKTSLKYRISLPVGVSYSADPQKVIEVIEDTAAANPRVLKYPPSQALFLGFGESSLDFELRSWAQFADFVEVRSELAVALYHAMPGQGTVAVSLAAKQETDGYGF
jgi:potassium efflux system protein